jgi:hypothetical protein
MWSGLGWVVEYNPNTCIPLSLVPTIERQQLCDILEWEMDVVGCPPNHVYFIPPILSTHIWSWSLSIQRLWLGLDRVSKLYCTYFKYISLPICTYNLSTHLIVSKVISYQKIKNKKSSNALFRLVECLIFVGDLDSHTHHEWLYVHLG